MNMKLLYGLYDSNRKILNMNVTFNVSPKYYSDLKSALKIKSVEGYSFVRIGLQDHDGGYVMLNDFQSKGIAYSFGISNDVSWDSIMAEIGYDIYMYDHTINVLPYENEHFHFFKEGISGNDLQNRSLKSLKYYIDRNNHSKKQNMILKMDVEGAEWEFLDTVDSQTLKQFDQIVLEYHNIIQTKDPNIIIKLLNKINETHQLVHLHGNNSGYIVEFGNGVFPDVIEATYVNRDKYKFSDCNEIFLPTELDAPNDICRKDVVIGNWNAPLEISE